MPAERLQKLLARAGHGSRRTAERLIVAGRVTVDGRVATLGERADPAQQRIELDGEALALPTVQVVLMLHKPVGYLVTAADERGRPTVYDLLDDPPPGLRYSGRLDRESAGLLLLTTDGELSFRLTHPRYAISKTYELTVAGVPTEASLKRLRRGIELDDGLTAPAKVTLVGSSGDRAHLSVVIHEGRKRQLRRMLAAVGHDVLELTRTRVGDLRLGALAAGASRPLDDAEELALRRAVGLVDGPSPPPI